MLLCLGLIADALGRDTIFKSCESSDKLFSLERHEIYRGSASLNAGVLYIARSASLPVSLSAAEDSALICIGTPPSSYLDKALNILVLNESEDFDELLNDIARIFFEFNTLEQKLQDAVNKGRSIQSMLDFMTPYLNSNELIVCNNDFRLIGKSSNHLRTNDISGVGQPDEEGYLPEELVTFFKNDLIFNKVRDLTEPFIYESSILFCRCICMNVFYRGEYACRVILTEDVNVFRGYEAGIVNFFTSFIQLVYDLAFNDSNILPEDNMSDIFIDLLRGESIEKTRLQTSFTERVWKESAFFHCAVILPSERDFYNRTVRYYCQTFNRDISGCCFVEFEGEIICVINLDYYGGLLENFMSQTLEVFRDGYFRVGYSGRFTDILDLRSFFTQAKIALRTGLRLKPFHWYHRFSDLVIPYMEEKLTEELDGRFMCAGEIIALRNYDEINGSELLKTLRVYLRNHMNAVKTAKELFIHRSTMVYRLERIAELTGIDFKNPAKNLYLMISVEMLLKE